MQKGEMKEIESVRGTQPMTAEGSHMEVRARTQAAQGAKIGPWMATSKETETSSLQLQENSFSENLNDFGNRFLPKASNNKSSRSKPEFQLCEPLNKGHSQGLQDS